MDDRNQIAEVKNLPASYNNLELSPAAGERQSAGDLYRRAQIIFQSDMAPKSFKTIKQLVYALGMGQDLGFTNLQSLANITVINNKPSVYADGLPAILLRSGHFFMEEFSGSIEDGTYKASITIERRDSGSIITREFSVDDAKRAGLWQTEPRIKKKGQRGPYEAPNDSPWWKYPKRMIWRRAIGWAVRDALADEMYGLQIAEEMQDHMTTIEASAEPKTSKLSEKLSKMGQEDDGEPEIIEIDIEDEEDLNPELDDKILDIDEDDISDGDASPPEDPNPAEVIAPSSAGEDPEPVFDSTGRKLPGSAIDLFDYLRSPMFDVEYFDRDLAQEQEQKWFKDMSDEDVEYILGETKKIFDVRNGEAE